MLRFSAQLIRPITRRGWNAIASPLRCYSSGTQSAPKSIGKPSEPTGEQRYNEQFGVAIGTRVHRPNEDVPTKRARILYQSRKRGILEMDLLLSTFTREHLDTLTEPELDGLDALLDENDWDLYYWLAGEKPTPEDLLENPVLPMLKQHLRNQGKQVRRMPDLDLSSTQAH